LAFNFEKNCHYYQRSRLIGRSDWYIVTQTNANCCGLIATKTRKWEKKEKGDAACLGRERGLSRTGGRRRRSEPSITEILVFKLRIKILFGSHQKGASAGEGSRRSNLTEKQKKRGCSNQRGSSKLAGGGGEIWAS